MIAANQLGEEEDVVGVIGPFSSGCAKLMLEKLNKESLPMISPSNSYDGLTREAPNNAKGEPGVYYPTGARTYARLVPTDVAQGGAGAEAMASLGATKACVLDDGTEYGKAVADGFAQAAGDFGLGVVCRTSWRPKPAGANYLGLMERVKASGADGVYLGGVSDDGGAELIRDKVTELGDNEAVKLVVSDGFLVDELFDDAGAANVEGIYATSPVVMTNGLTGPGKVFAADYAEKYGDAAGAVRAVRASRRSRCWSTRSAARTGRAPTSPRRCSRPASRRGSSARRRSTPTATASTRPSPLFQARDGAWVYID